MGTMKLTHYTNSIEALINILEHGFAWMRNDRIVIRSLLPEVNFGNREPQSFGQVCFSENTFQSKRDETKFFGSFGLEVSDEWARKYKAQPVLYIDDEGPVAESFRFLFEQFHSKALSEERYPNDAARQQWEVSCAMANIEGQPLYAELLKIYQYMEPARHFSEREWRIVNPKPDWGISNDTSKVVKNVSPPEGWAKWLHVVQIAPEDAAAIHCKQENHEALKKSLPALFQNVLIHTH